MARLALRGPPTLPGTSTFFCFAQRHAAIVSSLNMKHIITIVLLVCLCACSTTPSSTVSVPTEGTETYGYQEANPIKVGGPEGGPARERAFLSNLAGPKGEAIKFRRVGSCCPFKTPRGFNGVGLLDKYEVFVEGEQAPRILFLNMYDYEEPKVPRGFTRKNG